MFRCISGHNKQSQFLWISRYYLIWCLHQCFAFPCTLLAHFCFYLCYYCQQLVNMCRPDSGHPWNRTGYPKYLPVTLKYDCLSAQGEAGPYFQPPVWWYTVFFCMDEKWYKNAIQMYVCVWVSALSSVPTSLKFTDWQNLDSWCRHESITFPFYI